MKERKSKIRVGGLGDDLQKRRSCSMCVGEISREEFESHEDLT
ncbi:MAG: hypothetical protein ACLFU9_05650 [Candidatus Bathyarchaeia archaeon]